MIENKVTRKVANFKESCFKENRDARQRCTKAALPSFNIL